MSGMSPQRPLAWIVLALLSCLSAGAQPAGAQDHFYVQFDWPPLPAFDVPVEPFLVNAADVPKLAEYWGIIEEHKDEIDSATYERLRLSVKRAQEAFAAYERHARDFLRVYEPYESELKDLAEKIRQFNRWADSELNPATTYANRAEAEQFLAPFRAEYAVLRRQWDNFDARARRLGERMKNELKPEIDSASETLRRVVNELAEVTERLRKYPSIGAAGAVSGNVTATHSWEGATPVRLSSGMVVHYGDEIRTGPGGRMQVLLLDETVFTVGPNTELSLDEFVYDPSTGTGTITVTIARGLIKIVSGIIARKQPKKMKVRLPVGVTGPRGTEFIIEVGDDGRSRVDVLDGRVEFTSDRDGSSVQVRKGERLLVGASGTVGEVTEIDIEQVERTWAVATGSEPEAGVPPFERNHYVIGLVALLILLVAAWSKASGWHILPMVFVAVLFTACVMATGRLSTEGWWWWWWWMACASAGYFVFYWLVLLVAAIAKELTDALHRIWPVWIGLGVIATLAGLMLLYEGGHSLFNYISQFVYPRSILVSPRVYRQVSSGGEIMMFTAWAFAAVGLLVAIGGIRTVTGARQARYDHWTPPEDERDLEEAFPPPADYSDPGDDPDLEPPEGERDLEEAFPPPADYSDPGDDPDLEPPEHKPACPVCGGEFAGGRKSRCAQCGRFVHRASCLSRVTVEGGRLCKKCCAEDVGIAQEPVHAEAGTEESATECPDCGTTVRSEDRYCRSCGRSLSSWIAPAAATRRAKTRHQSVTKKDRKPTTGPPRPTMSLHSAAQTGRLDELKSHIHWGAIEGRLDLDVRDSHGATPLQLAAYNGHEEVVELLLGQGANVNVQDNEGATPLHLAACMNRKQIAGLLYVHGADINAQDNNGFTPLNVALARGSEAVADLLRMHGGQA